MLAKRLSNILFELCHGSDVATESLSDMEQRFKSLRDHGLLPRGQKNRHRQLTNEQIIATLLGLVTTKPSWAGHAARILVRLEPVGGSADFFGKAVTLSNALCNILADESASDSIVAVRLSIAEAGINSHGSAVIIYEQNHSRHYLSFVSSLAVSLLQKRAEQTFDPELRHAPLSREIVFNRYFFKRLSHLVKGARANPSPIIVDSSEYDEEEAKHERYLRLGVTPSSLFLNIGVDTMVFWPPEEKLIKFGKYKFVLMPKTKKHTQSIHIDLHSNELNLEEAGTIINRFLSLLTWCDDQFAIRQDRWYGSPNPVPVSKRNLAFAIEYHWVFDRDFPKSEEINRALALYREARNAEQNFMVSYAVLNYYKIVEIRYPKNPKTKKWIAQNFQTIKGRNQDDYNMVEFLKTCNKQKKNPEEYIYKACRIAVAHVREKNPSDPDSTMELSRLYTAAGVMRLLARYFICEELKVSESRFHSMNKSDL